MDSPNFSTPPNPMPQAGNREARSFQTVFKRADGDGDGRTIEGYAAVFNSRTKIGWFEEEIATGAFDDAIKRSDCRALFNHDNNHLLARQSSKTLTLELDEKGLKYRFDAPNTQTGNDILEMIARGDLAESSFAFTVKSESWEEEKDDNGKWHYRRVIKEVDILYDVSPVTYPAYADTSVAKRSFDNWKGETDPPSPPQPTYPVEAMRAVFQ